VEPGSCYERCETSTRPRNLFGIDLLPWLDEDLKPDVTLLTGPAEQRLAELEPVDRVLLVEIMEHLSAPWDVLRTAARLVVPGGRIVITTPHVANLRHRLELATRGNLTSFRAANTPHLQPILPHVTESSLKEAGLGGFGETIGETREARRSAAGAWGKIALDAPFQAAPACRPQRPTGIRSPLVRPLTWYPRRLAYKAYELTHPHEPWLAQGAVRFLDRELPRDGIGLEWGSGRSTAWLGQRLARLTSVEFDESWYQRVRERVNGNVDLRYVPLEHDRREPTVPVYDPPPRYVAVVEGLGPLDFALVDGHYRQACILAVLPALRPGALLAVDNTNWLPEAEWGVPSDWPLVHRSANVMTETSVWRKPGG
jgi:hypothetical protein